MRSKFRSITSFIALLAIMLSTLITGNFAFAVEAGSQPIAGPITEPSLGSETAILIDGDTGTILYDKNSDQKIYPASTCKVLTAIVAIENSDLDDIITVSENAMKGQEDGGSHIALEPGERITMRDALHGLLLASGNDAAIAIAEHVAGSESKFAKMMTDKAKELGLKHSHFVNPFGFYADGQYTTVHDLAYITEYALQNKDFLKIFSAISYTIPPTNKHKEPSYPHNNHGMTKYKYRAYRGVIGGKTGFITESRFNLITAAKRGNLTLIAVVGRGDSGPQNIDDTVALFNYGFKKYQLKSVKKTDEGKPLSSLIEDKSYLLDRCKLASNKMKMVVRRDKADEPKFDLKIDDKLSYPIDKGQKVGQLQASQEGKVIGSIDIVAEKKINSKLKHNLMIGGSILIILILVIAFLLWTSSMRRKKRMRKNKMASRRNMRTKRKK